MRMSGVSPPGGSTRSPAPTRRAATATRKRWPPRRGNSRYTACSPAVGVPSIRASRSSWRAAARASAAARVSPFTSTATRALRGLVLAVERNCCSSHASTVRASASNKSTTSPAATRSSPPANRRSSTTPCRLVWAFQPASVSRTAAARPAATRPTRRQATPPSKRLVRASSGAGGASGATAAAGSKNTRGRNCSSRPRTAAASSSDWETPARCVRSTVSTSSSEGGSAARPGPLHTLPHTSNRHHARLIAADATIPAQRARFFFALLHRPDILTLWARDAWRGSAPCSSFSSTT